MLRKLDYNSMYCRQPNQKQATLAEHFRKYKMKKKGEENLCGLYA